MSSSLRTVQRWFPEVTSIRDAKEPIEIEVTADDERRSKKLNHKECAMAVACKRSFKADGVILSRTIAYVVTGKSAIRFKVPGSVGREVTAFDRGAHFMPGVYQLSKPDRRLGKVHGGNKPKTGKEPQEFRHITTGIRAVLGGKDVQV